MAFTERLAILVSADGEQAIRELGKVGDAAEKELGRAGEASKNYSASFVRAGAMAVGATAVLGAGLYKAAMAFDSAEQQQIKLQNSLRNNPALAGQSIDSFNKLAQSIQRKTAADGDAIVGGMAMLGTFRVTGEQIREITPLIVDYSRKFGVDLVSANAAVGKALDGSIGALKRNGVTIDESRYAADRYGAVLEGLRSQVGGFAEAEGKTFSGQLERMRNNLGDVTESIGGGVVKVMNQLLPIIGKATDGFKFLDNATAGSVGEFTTFGVIGLGTVGTFLLITGGVLKLRAAIIAMRAESTLANTALSTLGAAAPVAVGIGAVAIAGNALAHAMGQASKEISFTADQIRGLTAAGLEEVGRQASKVANVDFFQFDEALKKLAADSPQAAQQLLNAMTIDEETRNRLQRVIDAQAGAQRRIAQANEEEANSNNDVTLTLQQRIDKTYELINAQLGAQGAALNVESATKRYNEALFIYGEGSFEARQAALQLEQAFVALGASTGKAAVESGASTEDAARRQVDALTFVAGTLDPGSPLRARLQAYIDQLNGVPGIKQTVVDVNYVGRWTSDTVPPPGDWPGGADGDPATPYPMAKGGIVTRPTNALIGEAGPEAVIPLGKGAGMGTTIQLVVDGRVLTQIVRDDLIRIGRANGSALGQYA